MYFLLLDAEQAGMLLDAAHAAEAILSHRQGRADPDGIVTKSMDLQKRKLVQVMAQLDLPVEPNFYALPVEQQEKFIRDCQAIGTTSNPDERATIYRAIFASYLSHRSNLLREKAQNTNAKTTQKRPSKNKNAPENEESGTGK